MSNLGSLTLSVQADINPFKSAMKEVDFLAKTVGRDLGNVLNFTPNDTYMNAFGGAVSGVARGLRDLGSSSDSAAIAAQGFEESLSRVISGGLPDIIQMVASLGDSMNGLSEISGSESFINALSGISNTSVLLSAPLDPIVEVIRGMGKGFGDLNSAILTTITGFDQLAEVAVFVRQGLTDTAKVIDTLAVSVLGFGIDKILEMNGVDRGSKNLDEFISTSREFISITTSVKMMLGGVSDLFDDFAIALTRAKQELSTNSTSIQFVDNALQKIGDTLNRQSDQFRNISNEIKRASGSLNSIRSIFQYLNLDFSLGNSILGQYIDQTDDLISRVTGASNTLRGMSNIVSGAGQEISELSSNVENLISNNIELANSTSSVAEAMERGSVFFEVWQNASNYVDSVFGGIEEQVQKVSELEQVYNRLNFISIDGAKSDLSFIDELASKYRVSIEEMQKGFLGMQSSARGTVLEGEAIRSVFDSVTQASAVMGLSGEETSGVFLAMGQMMSKGTVSAEELRGQLAERIPGAFQIAARAMKMTTSELDQLVSSGELAATDFLPRFSEQLKSETAPGLIAYTNSFKSAWTDLENSLLKFKQKAGQVWVDIGTPFFNFLANVVDKLTEFEQFFSSVMDALLAAAGISLLQSAFSVIKGFVTHIGIAKEAIMKTAGQLKPLVVQYAVAYAGLMTFYAVLDRVKGPSEEYVNALQSIEGALLKIKEASGASGDSLHSFKENLSGVPPTDWLDSIIDKMNKINALGKLVAVSAGFAGLHLPKGETKIHIRTNAEKNLDRDLETVSKIGMESQKLIDHALSSQASGSMQKLSAIDAEIAEIRKRRSLASEEELELIKKLGQEEAKLLGERQKIADPILAIKSGYDSTIASLKTLQNSIDPSVSGVEGANQLEERTSQIISLLEKTNNSFKGLFASASLSADAFISDHKNRVLSLQQENTKAVLQVQDAANKGLISSHDASIKLLTLQEQFSKKSLADLDSYVSQLKDKIREGELIEQADPSRRFKEREVLMNELAKKEEELAQKRIETEESVQKIRMDIDNKIIELARKNGDERQKITEMNARIDIAWIKKAMAERQITSEQGNKKILEIEIKANEERRGMIKSEVEILDKARKEETISVTAYEERRTELANEFLDLIEKSAEQQIALQKQIVDAYEEKLSVMSEEISLQQSLNELALVNAEAAGASELELGEMKLEQLRQMQEMKRQELELQLAKNLASAEDVELQQQLNELALKRFDVDAESQVKKLELSNRSSAGDASAGDASAGGGGDYNDDTWKRRYEGKIALINAESDAVAHINELRSLEIELIDQAKSALEVKASVAEAEENYAIAALEQQLAMTDELLNIQAEGAEAQKVRSELAKELGLKLGTSEIEILEKKREIEAEIGAAKEAQMARQHALQDELLAMELQQNILNAEQAVQEAKINELKAQQAIIEAEMNAQSLRSDDADISKIRAAEKGIDLARESLELAQSQSVNAQEQLKLIGDQNVARQKALDIQQATESSELNASNEAADRAGRLAIATAEAKSSSEGMADAMGKVADSAGQAANAMGEAADAAKDMSGSKSSSTTSNSYANVDLADIAKRELELAAKIAEASGNTAQAQAIRDQIASENKKMELKALQDEAAYLREQRALYQSERQRFIDQTIALSKSFQRATSVPTLRNFEQEAATKAEKFFGGSGGIGDLSGGKSMQLLGEALQGFNPQIQKQQMVAQQQMGEAIESGNKEVGGKLDKINDTIGKAMSRPTEVNISGSEDIGGDVSKTLKALQIAQR